MSKSIYISFLIQPFLDSITGFSVGVPADNPKMESIKGWIKDEIMNDWNNDITIMNF